VPYRIPQKTLNNFCHLLRATAKLSNILTTLTLAYASLTIGKSNIQTSLVMLLFLFFFLTFVFLVLNWYSGRLKSKRGNRYPPGNVQFVLVSLLEYFDSPRFRSNWYPILWKLFSTWKAASSSPYQLNSKIRPCDVFQNRSLQVSFFLNDAVLYKNV